MDSLPSLCIAYPPGTLVSRPSLLQKPNAPLACLFPHLALRSSTSSMAAAPFGMACFNWASSACVCLLDKQICLRSVASLRGCFVPTRSARGALPAASVHGHLCFVLV